MPSSLLPITPYKGVFVLILLFVALEYFFSNVSDTKGTIFNSTGSHSNYGPLLKTLVFKNNNSTIYPTNFNFNQNISEPYQNYMVSVPSTFFRHPTLKTHNLSEMQTSIIEASSSTVSAKSTDVLNAGYIISKVPETTTELSVCNDGMQYLYGRVEVIKDRVPTVQELEKRFSWLHPGGHWEPEECRVEKKVAIVIPYRARGEHLLLFLQHMHPFLKRQQLDYTIFIIEQDADGPFNRAMLMNIGYVEALKSRDFDCFIFHDIDLLPEDDRNLYNCPEQPRHMSVAVDMFKYKLPYPAIFGGVCAIKTDHFKLLNGFSNSFWGWGGEDDDMSNRIRYHKLHISRYPITIARYTMLTHKKGTPSPSRYDVLKKGLKLFDKDGLVNLKYDLRQKKQKLLYTWVLVKISVPKS